MPSKEKDNFVAIKPAQVVIGKGVPYDVYNKQGQRILAKNKLVTTEKQKEILLNTGLFLIEFPGTEHTIKDLTTRFKIQLVKAFDALERDLPESFIRDINRLALDIQQHCDLRADALLGALHSDHQSVYWQVHPLHCAAMVEVVAKSMGMPILDRLSLVCAALTQNISYYKYQQDIHNKTTELSDEEKEMIRTHPLRSYQLLVNAGVNDHDWLDIVSNHHERIDGSGYPHGLNAQFFPLKTKILLLADTFAAATRQCAYSDETISKDAMRDLLAQAGKRFCETTTRLFVKQIGAYPCGTYVKILNNEIGIVTAQTDSANNPILAVIIDVNGIKLKKPQLRDSRAPEYAITEVLSFDKHMQFEQWISKLWPNFTIS